jgi:hypothetical protein
MAMAGRFQHPLQCIAEPVDDWRLTSN